MKTIRSLLATLLLTVAVTSCASSPAVVELSADWVYYKDVASLDAAADLVVEATVLSRRSQMIGPVYVPGDSPEEDPYYGSGLSEEEIKEILAQEEPVPGTYVTMRVESVVRGPVEPGSEIILVELGGLIDGTDYRVSGVPAMADGETYLLFAQEDLDGTYAVVGGAAGLYQPSAQGYAAVGDWAPEVSLTRQDLAGLG